VGALSDGIDTVVAVYGVLFLDWNSQGSPDNQPFHGVCYQCEKGWGSLLTYADPIMVFWLDGIDVDERSSTAER